MLKQSTAFLVILLLALAVIGVFCLIEQALAAEPELPYYQELTLSENYSAALFSCHVGVKSIRLIEQTDKVLHGKPIIHVLADRNYDGAPDMLLMFDSNNGEAGPFPHYYVYDTDFDGRPDIAYRDVNGNGVCQEMEQIPVNYVVNSDPRKEASEQ